MRNSLSRLLPVAAVAFSLSWPSPAFSEGRKSFGLAATGGMSQIRNALITEKFQNQMLTGGEILLGKDKAEAVLFVEHNRFTGTRGDQSILFWGIGFRGFTGQEQTGFFIDGKVDALTFLIAVISSPDGPDRNLLRYLSAGMGVGVSIPVTRVMQLRVRTGFRTVSFRPEEGFATIARTIIYEPSLSIAARF